MSDWNFDIWPADAFNHFEDVISSVAHVEDNGRAITYEWIVGSPLVHASVLMHCAIGTNARDQVWTWLFTHTGTAGFMLLQAETYLLDEPEPGWQVSFAIPPDRFTLTQIGEFGSVIYYGDTIFIHMYPALWGELPDDERNP